MKPIEQEGERVALSRYLFEGEEPLTVSGHRVLWQVGFGWIRAANSRDGGLATNSGPGLTPTPIIEPSVVR